jgi:hypothetical protein
VLFSLEGSGFAQLGASGAFSDANSASCSNFVWLRSSGAADAEYPRLAASCFLKGPGRTVVSRLRRFGISMQQSPAWGYTAMCLKESAMRSEAA